MTIEILDRMAAANPVPDHADVSPNLWTTATLRDAIEERRLGMQTHEKLDKTTPPKGLRNGVFVAAAAFVAVIVVAAIIVLSRGGDVRPASETSVTSTAVPDQSLQEIPTRPFTSVVDAATAFVHQWNDGTYEGFSGILVNRGEVNRSRLPAEQEEQFWFRRALGSRLELGACTENSSISITCQVTQDDRVHQLLSGGADDGYQLTLRTLGGAVEGWSFTSAAGRDPGLWAEWSAWAKANSATLIEIDPRADTGGQLGISAEEAANLYIGEIERFLAETGLG